MLRFIATSMSLPPRWDPLFILSFLVSIHGMSSSTQQESQQWQSYRQEDKWPLRPSKDNKTCYFEGSEGMRLEAPIYHRGYVYKFSADQTFVRLPLKQRYLLNRICEICIRLVFQQAAVSLHSESKTAEKLASLSVFARETAIEFPQAPRYQNIVTRIDEIQRSWNKMRIPPLCKEEVRKCLTDLRDCSSALLKDMPSTG